MVAAAARREAAPAAGARPGAAGASLMVTSLRAASVLAGISTGEEDGGSVFFWIESPKRW